MRFLHRSLAVCAALIALNGESSAQVDITTWQVNLQHTGNNASETILTPGNISSPGNFGLLFSQSMDGMTFGQPLLVSGLTVAGATHNVVYAATEHCSLFAFDADSNSGNNSSPLWQASLLPAGTVPVPQSVVGSGDIPIELGITTTPVIDTGSSTIYIVSKVQRTSDTTYHQYLYALDLATGAAKFGSPVEITASFPGTSSDASGGSIPFSPLHEHLRSAMVLYDGIIYLAYASHSDTTPYHGEILGYDATKLTLVKSFITTPNNGTPEGGIWQSGASPAVDSSGNMYVAVGNGAWDQTSPSYGTNWGESMLKLPTSGTFDVSYSNTLNWFTPNNWQTLNNGDLDVGSGGLTLLPDQSGPHQHILVGAGKGSVIYVVDRDNMSGMNSPDGAIQEIPDIGGNYNFATPAYYNGYIYFSNSGGPLEQRAVGYNSADGSYISTTPTTSTDVFNNKGSSCFISSNGTTNGIVWILDGSGIRAYNATNVSGSPIYTANATLPGNVSCQNTKFSIPMVANGKLYYTAYSGSGPYTGHLLVYGLLPTPAGSPAAPSDAAASATSSSSTAVTWTSHSNDESGFIINRSTSPTTGFTKVGTAGAGVTTYPDTGLSPLTTYYYQVMATNTDGTSSATNVASATTFPSYTENGLVAFWRMDETGGGTVSDSTAASHTGTINGEAAIATGYINNGVNFHGNGEASNISVADTSDLEFTAAQSFTVSAWINPSTVTGKEETIIAKSRDTGNYYGIWLNTSGQWVFRGPGGDVTSGSTTVSQGTWTHVAVVQNGAANTRTIYVNGLATGSGAAQAGNGTGAFWMAQQNVSGSPESFVGTLDEVRVYNRALAASEITNLMGPAVLDVQSTQTHGSAGVFGYTVWPFTAKAVEPRKGSVVGAYNLVMYFPTAVSGITATLGIKGGGTPVGKAGTVSYDSTGRTVTVPLTGVGNAQGLNVHLSGITPGGGTADIPFNVLWGDVNADNIVDSLIDPAIVQHNDTTVVAGSTYLYDLNCDGVVNATDNTLVTNAAGTSLGAQIPTDLAIYQPAVALSSNGGNTPDMAVDQSLISRWESTQQVDPEWMYVNLGSVCTIQTVILDWENAAGENYTIQVANNSSGPWNTVQTITGNTTSGIHTYPSLNTTGQYVRMYGTMRDSNYGYSLLDFQVIGLSGTTGSSTIPTVNSATAETATTGNAFSYQIAATNSPTSFNATGLPAGLSVSTSTGLISGTPTRTGTASVTISATNASGTGSETLTITVEAPFQAWENLYFTSAQLANPAVSGPMVAPAGDGISNLMKYALNLNPNTGGVGGLPVESITSTGGKQYLTLTYTQVIADTDLTYTVQVSSDLATWSSGSSDTSAPAVTNNSDGKTQTVVVQDLTAEGSAARRFIRLQVIQTQPPVAPNGEKVAVPPGSASRRSVGPVRKSQ